MMYTGLEQEENLVEIVFFAKTIFGGQTTLVSGLLKLENFT